jgi:hypothetical protein
MPAAKERLSQLLALVAERRWTPLARELAALALDWPNDYPPTMRSPVMALLEWAARECDMGTRTEIAAHMGGHPELPLSLLNELYLAAPAPLRREILMRNELERDDSEAEEPADAETLLRAARNGCRDFAAMLGGIADIPRAVAQAILSDTSGEPLAVLCRGAGFDRATFSAIVVLRGCRGVSLTVFDTVPEHAAHRLMRHWRAHHVTPHFQAAAAE